MFGMHGFPQKICTPLCIITLVEGLVHERNDLPILGGEDVVEVGDYRFTV